MKDYYTYILASQTNGTLCVGVMNCIERRYFEHLAAKPGSFTGKYGIKHLVYFENFNDIKEAISREKQLKNWHRQWKINLIETMNPLWQDLSKKYRMGAETILAYASTRFSMTVEKEIEI